MAIAGQSFLQDLGSTTIDTATYSNYNNFVMCRFGDDDDDDASFEVSEVPNALSDDINLAEAIGAIKKETTFTYHGTLDDEGDNTKDSESAVEKAEHDGLKQELRAKIQKRRLSRGDGELKVTFDPPKLYPLSPYERQKVEKRKERNRDSANRSRLKRKQYEDELTKEVKRLHAENESLEKEIKATREQKRTLQKFLEIHLATYHPTDSTSSLSTAPFVDSRVLASVPGTTIT